jgi:hypothetical protein
MLVLIGAGVIVVVGLLVQRLRRKVAHIDVGALSVQWTAEQRARSDQWG